MVIALSIAIACLVAVNVAATLLLAKANDLVASQKAAQLAFTWLVPFVGAVVVISIRKEFTQPYQQRAVPPESTDYNAIDLALSVRRGPRRHEDDADIE